MPRGFYDEIYVKIVDVVAKHDPAYRMLYFKLPDSLPQNR